MFGFLKKIFGNKNHDSNDLSFDSNEKYIFEVQDDEDEFEYSEGNMRLEQEDSINGGSPMQEVTDSVTGRTHLVSPDQATRLVKGDIPDGYNIPGIGNVTAQNQHQPRQQRPQRPAPAQAPQRPQQQHRPAPVQQRQQRQQAHVQQTPVEPEENALPPLEVAVINSEYHLFMDLAGVKKESLTTEFEDGCLIITGTRLSSIDTYIQSLKKATRKKDVDVGDTHSTIPSNLMNSFKFEMPFKKMVDESSIQAVLEDGILHVTLPHRVKGSKVVVPIM